MLNETQIKAIVEGKRVDNLLSIINSLDESIRSTVISALKEKLNMGKKIQTLNVIKQKTYETDAQIKSWLLDAIPDSYIKGMNATEKDLKKESSTVEQLLNDAKYTDHKLAVNSIISDVYLDFANTMTGVQKGVEKTLNDALKKQTRIKLIEGNLSGQSVQAVAKDVKELFQDKGFSVLLDKGGRSWSLARYSEMITRTHMIGTANTGVINRAIDFGIDIVQISKNNGTLKSDIICFSQEGKIYSLSGNSKNYRKLVVEPPFHPNCRHVLLLRPDLE